MLSWLAVPLAPLSCAAATAGTGTDETRCAPLSGIQSLGLSVTTQLFDPNLSYWLKERIQAVAEKRLTSCGIQINATEVAEPAGQPILTIAIASKGAPGASHIEATVNIWDMVRSSRAQEQMMRLSTWGKRIDLPENADKDDIANHATSLLDSFTADYLVANPRAGAQTIAPVSTTDPTALRGLSPKQPPTESIPLLSGAWDSTYGTVTLHQGDKDNNGFIPVSGYWTDANMAKRGEIQVGKFDPKTRTLTFSFYQPWNKCHGKAILKLSADGHTFDGTKRTGAIHKWRWAMWR